MSHHVGQGEKKKWLKLVYLSNIITWRGFGNTNKKGIQKLKERVEPDKRKEKGEKEERRKKKKEKQQERIWRDRKQQQKMKA